MAARRLDHGLIQDRLKLPSLLTRGMLYAPEGGVAPRGEEIVEHGLG